MTPEDKATITRIILDDKELRGYYSKSLRFRDAVDDLVRRLPSQIATIAVICKEQQEALAKHRHPSNGHRNPLRIAANDSEI